MIDWLRLNKLDKIELCELTNNTIIIFKNKSLLFKFKMELSKIIEDIDTKDVDFTFINDSDTIKIQTLVSSDSIEIYEINNGEQKIILGIETSLIFLVENIRDLWLYGYDHNDTEACVALTEYEDYERYKNDNLKLYKAVNQGKFLDIGGR